MQGRLRDEHLQTKVVTECAQTGQTIEMEIDSELNINILRGGPDPIVFSPPLDLPNWRDPSIIDNF